MSYQYEHQQKVGYSRQDISSLNRALIELESVYNSHFQNLNLRCLNNQITQQEFFNEQQKLTKLIGDIRNIKTEIEQYNQSVGVVHGKLTLEEKKQIYYYYKTGNYKQTQLADMFGVTQPTISEICNNSVFSGE